MPSLAALYAELRVKQEQLQRLQQCESSLKSSREDFFHNEHLCLKPEVSRAAWRGHLAKRFQTIREDGIYRAYKKIEQDQFADTFQSLHTKMNQLRAEISALHSAIAAAERTEAERAKVKG